MALSAIALTLIAGQVMVQYSITHQEKFSYLINIAGRQRMLSQKLCKMALIICSGKGNNDTYNELDQDLRTWEYSHYQITKGLPETRFNYNTQFTTIKLQEIENDQRIIAVNCHQILKHKGNIAASNRYLTPILEHESAFLKGMILIVEAYQKDAEERLQFLKRTELMLFILTMIILAAEALLIFLPASNKIKKSFFDLRTAERKYHANCILLSRAKDRLKEANTQLEKKVEERTGEVIRKNRELENKNYKLNTINKDLGTFVHTASHDLRGPILNIEALLNKLAKDVPEVEKEGKIVFDFLNQSIGQFKHVLKELAQTESEDKEGISLFEPVIKEVELMLAAQIRLTEAKIHYDFSQATGVKIHPKHLRSIFYNLLSNAIKYKSSKPPVINITTQEINGGVNITFEDNGIGMTEEQLHTLFKKHVRFREDIEGTGVGLTNVKEIIELNNGKIEVYSKMDVGTTFVIFFRKPS